MQCGFTPKIPTCRPSPTCSIGLLTNLRNMCPSPALMADRLSSDGSVPMKTQVSSPTRRLSIYLPIQLSSFPMNPESQSQAFSFCQKANILGGGPSLESAAGSSLSIVPDLAETVRVKPSVLGLFLCPKIPDLGFWLS